MLSKHKNKLVLINLIISIIPIAIGLYVLHTIRISQNPESINAYFEDSANAAFGIILALIAFSISCIFSLIPGAIMSFISVKNWHRFTKMWQIFIAITLAIQITELIFIANAIALS